MSIIVQHRRDTRAVLEAVTPAEGEIGYDKDLKALRAGDGATLGGILAKLWGKSYVLSPAQITASQNDYNPTDLKIAETLLLDLSANWNITGLAGGATNREIAIYNGSTSRLTLTNEDAASVAANRFHFGQNVVLRPYQGLRLVYSAVLSRWVAIGRLELGVTDLPEGVTLSGECRPAQVTVNQNDWDPADAGTSLAWSASRASSIYVSTDASHNITGLGGGVKGRLAVIINSGTNAVVLKNADVGSTAANRFDMSSDVTLAGKQSAVLEYDATASRWKCLANTGGAAVAAGAVTAQTLANSAVAARAGIVNGVFVESHAGNAATFAIKTLLGSDPTAADPVYFVFNDGTGAYKVRTVTAALSVTLSSDSSVGVANSVPFRLWVVAIDNAGTVELGVVNCSDASGVMRLSEANPVTTVAEGGAGAADSVKTIYTTTARASKYLAIVGYADYDAGLATAGAWAAAPSRLIEFSAGVPRPGDIIQEVYSTSGADFSTSSNTPVASTTTISITPGSPANLVEVAVRGVGDMNAAGRAFTAQLSRGNANGTNMIGNKHVIFSTGASIQGPISLSAVDKPGTAASQLYAVQVFNAAGVASITWLGATYQPSLLAKEIMG